MAQSISLAASISLSDLSETRVSRKPLGRFQLDLFLAARRIRARLIPVHIGQLDAHFIVQPAAHIDRCRMGPFRRTDALSLEIFGMFDAAFLVDVKRAEPEQARTDHRQPDDVGIVPRHLGREFGEGKF